MEEEEEEEGCHVVSINAFAYCIIKSFYVSSKLCGFAENEFERKQEENKKILLLVAVCEYDFI